MTQTNAFKTDGQEPPARFCKLNKMAAQPCKDLHMSGTTTPVRQRSCTLQTNFLPKQAPECPLAPKKGREVPEKRYLASSGTLHYLPQSPLSSRRRRSRVRRPAPARCRSGGGLEEGEAPPPVPIQFFARTISRLKAGARVFLRDVLVRTSQPWRDLPRKSAKACLAAARSSESATMR